MKNKVKKRKKGLKLVKKKLTGEEKGSLFQTFGTFRIANNFKSPEKQSYFKKLPIFYETDKPHGLGFSKDHIKLKRRFGKKALLERARMKEKKYQPSRKGTNKDSAFGFQKKIRIKSFKSIVFKERQKHQK